MTLALLLSWVGLLAPLPAAAQFVRPWAPPSQDSLLAWSAEARARFRTCHGDSASGANYLAYERVGRIGRRLLQSLGREHLAQAMAIEPVLDSLGLDTEVTIDPALPYFVLMVARNPFRPSAEAVGFLYWVRGQDLRMQGVVLRSGWQVKMRVWWTGQSRAPYSWAILGRVNDEGGRLGLLLLRLNANGHYWNLVQFEANAPDLGEENEGFWVDVNHDHVPELVTWGRTHPDSSFEECRGCPRILTESIYVVREAGFELHDSRLLPSPYASFVLFIRLLREGDRASAARLLVDPAKLDEALALGWGTRSAGRAWSLEYAEPDQRWPRWLALRFEGGEGRPLYIVHFTMSAGRWIISGWTTPSGSSAGSPGKGGARSR